MSLILLLLLLLVPLDLRPETKCAGHSCLALRRCLSCPADFVGPPCLEEIEFTGPGFVASGLQQCVTPESAAQIGHHLSISGTGSKSSAGYWGCIGSLSNSESISQSFPSEVEAKIYLQAAGITDVVFAP